MANSDVRDNRKKHYSSMAHSKKTIVV